MNDIFRRSSRMSFGELVYQLIEPRYPCKKSLQGQRKEAVQRLAQARGRKAIHRARQDLENVDRKISALNNPRNARAAKRTTFVSGQMPRSRS